ncbi:MAG: CDGSH iron-sulfur domain-containing protein [SAR324 cluster bacterium]|uniref:CDGSH iron-sulfur domain-containing protein n=1 Tax=SAR324 cluster bacterium TaxID=2024889 RepID=A0A7X9FRT6_9DELT|nr:CDGSH iron-sulfur domain-containing protein [SAR324 cluster bacterium]
MAEDPKVAQKAPYVLDMEPGIYWWCSCGHSASQPFCDGSHKGTSFSPKEVRFSEKTKVAWCGCKHSKNGHQCDGTHENL